ncbi:hypothetical protein FISHEDRAFT_57712 [Fistulina hepatica ATCC 64428]|uniref:BTB domain-containing protein n=1 Tax=Fistulina hepatica ATCC 64428 TaxID=1128425 RepID=A0A0D7AFD7_9AGAR|nr:hypothetical protein FISHEDRAFT_57712 [Fistulina hepatica ATCC 64428]
MNNYLTPPSTQQPSQPGGATPADDKGFCPAAAKWAGLEFRHPKYYDRYGDTTMQGATTNGACQCQTHDAEGNITSVVNYKLSVGRLRNFSVGFDNMFGIPPKPDDKGMTEGRDDEHPIVVTPAVAPAEWEHLVIFIYGSVDELPDTLDFRFDILRLLSLYDIPMGRRWAIAQLMHRNIGPVKRFTLAREHNVVSWLPKAVGGMLTRGLGRLTVEDMWQIGPEQYFVLDQALQQIDRFRKAWILKRYDLRTAPECQSKQACETSWEYHWGASITANALHPERDFASSPQQIILMLKHKPLTGVCASCQSNAIEDLEKHTPDQEDKIINDAKRKVMELQGANNVDVNEEMDLT